MKPFEDAWSGLKQRRLLPVAILLLAALVAIPFLLAKNPEPAAPGVPAAGNGAAKDEAAVADPVVTLAEANTGVKQRRRVLGATKNPFQPGPAAKVATTTEDNGTTVATGGEGGTPADKPADSGPVTTPGGSAPVAPTYPGADVPAAPKPTYELYSLTVDFGSAESETGSLERMNLPRLKALPSADEPILVYLGPGKGAKSAIFMVDEGVVPQGDGTCRPSPANCETIELAPGETEFFDVVDEEGNTSAQYQLDLVKIKTSKTTDASKAAAARAKVSKAGRSVLKAREAAVGPLRYRYESKSGLVRKLDKRAYRALLANSARAALGTAGGF